jgi:hypothetical protein
MRLANRCAVSRSIIVNAGETFSQSDDGAYKCGERKSLTLVNMDLSRSALPSYSTRRQKKKYQHTFVLSTLNSRSLATPQGSVEAYSLSMNPSLQVLTEYLSTFRIASSSPLAPRPSPVGKSRSKTRSSFFGGSASTTSFPSTSSADEMKGSSWDVARFRSLSPRGHALAHQNQNPRTKNDTTMATKSCPIWPDAP